jgi:hypothetical protein
MKDMREIIRTLSNRELIAAAQQQAKGASAQGAWDKVNEVLRDPTALGIVYNSGGKDYYQQNAEGRWVRFSREAIRNQLKVKHKLPGMVLAGVDYTAINAALAVIETGCEVALAVSLAGHFAGIEIGRDKTPILITTSPNLIVGRPGPWPNWEHLLHELFGNQFEYFWGSLAIARQSLFHRRFVPNRAQILAGPPSCGKTLLARRLITPLLGGRHANPYDYMTQSTNFNADMIGSEHLALDDDNPHYDKRSRETFGNMIKKVVATPEHALHPKGVDKYMVQIHWYLSIMVNDSPHSLQILPALDEALLDKVCLYRLIKSREIKFPATPNEMDEFNAKLDAELPALAYALDSYEVSEALQCERYLIKAYHHPELLVHLRDYSSGAELEELLFDYWVRSYGLFSAAEIFTNLKEDTRARHILAEIANDSQSLGMKLSELADRQSHIPSLPWKARVIKTRNAVSNKNQYKIVAADNQV